MSQEMFGNVLFIPPDVFVLRRVTIKHTEVKLTQCACLCTCILTEFTLKYKKKKTPKDFEFCATDVIFTLSPVAT